MPGMRYQPQGIANIDARNPLAEGLLSAQVAGSLSSYAGGPSGRHMLGMAFSTVRDPKFPVTTSSASSGVFSGAQAFTLAALVRRINPGGSNNHFAIRYRVVGNVNSTIVSLGVVASTGGASISFSVPNVATVSANIGAPPAGGETILLVGVWDKVSDQVSLYANGVKVASAAIGTGAIAHTSNAGVYLADANGGVANTGCLPYATFIWPRRALTEADVKALASNPWQVFADPNDEYHYAIAAPATSSVSVEAASLLLGGGDVAIRVSRRVGIQAAVLAISGGEVPLRVTRRIAVAPAEMTLVGGTIQFQHSPASQTSNYVMPITPAALSLGGGEVGLRVTRRMPVAPGSLSLGAGQVLLLASRRVTITPAAMIVTGGAVSLRYSEQIEYARAPAGSGYSPQRVTVQARPAQVGGFRPAATQRNNR